jgi:H+-transporting ATPase
MSAPNFEKEPGPQGETPVETPSPDVPEAKKKREYKDFGHDEEKPTRTFIISCRASALWD